MTLGNKTALFGRQQPGGTVSIESMHITTGDRWWVSSTTTGAVDAADAGRSPDVPFATLDYAISQVTASVGDIIYVMPAHAEDVDGAAALNFDVAGIKVVGLGRGDLRPIFSLSAEASTVQFDADDLWIENLIFEGTFTNGTTVGLDIKTGCDDLMIKNCVIRGGAITTELLVGVTIEATNNRITFDGCEFYEHAGDATVAVISEGAFTDLRFLRCTWIGTWATAILDLDHTAVTTQALYMEDCTMVSHGAADGLMITLADTTVAQFLRVSTFGNQSAVIPLAAADDGASLGIQCFGTDAFETSGIVWPHDATAWTT